jgi:hypothetical protein
MFLQLIYLTCFEALDFSVAFKITDISIFEYLLEPFHEANESSGLYAAFRGLRKIGSYCVGLCMAFISFFKSKLIF